jgi:hypothetical protein
MACDVKALFLPLRAKKTMHETRSAYLRKFVVLSVFLYLMLEMIRPWTSGILEVALKIQPFKG